VSVNLFFGVVTRELYSLPNPDVAPRIDQLDLPNSLSGWVHFLSLPESKEVRVSTVLYNWLFCAVDFEKPFSGREFLVTFKKF